MSQCCLKVFRLLGLGWVSQRNVKNSISRKDQRGEGKKSLPAAWKPWASVVISIWYSTHWPEIKSQWSSNEWFQVRKGDRKTIECLDWWVNFKRWNVNRSSWTKISRQWTVIGPSLPPSSTRSTRSEKSSEMETLPWWKSVLRGEESQHVLFTVFP